MCTPTVAKATAVTAGAFLAGPVGALATYGAIRGLEGKRVIGSDIIPKPPKVPKLKPPPDPRLEERRQRARAISRTLAGRPGQGRAATIFTRGTGSGPAGLKTATGQ
jgi:hypothetical protein